VALGRLNHRLRVSQANATQETTIVPSLLLDERHARLRSFEHVLRDLYQSLRHSGRPATFVPSANRRDHRLLS